jgi:prepilin-type N-terminal cleavage/methylation domain-containing protein
VRREEGFTLIETLIALTVAATAAAVILAQVRGLYQRAERETAATYAATRLLNNAARLGADAAWRDGAMQVRDGALVPTPPPAWLAGVLAIHNFAVSGDARSTPPVEAAYTPFQRAALAEDGRELCLLVPALRSPAGMVTKEAAKPAK